MNLDKVLKIEYIVWKVRSKLSYEIKKLPADNKFRLTIESFKKKRLETRKNKLSFAKVTQTENLEETNSTSNALPFVDLSLRELTLRELEK
jgi:hypothetical protein